MREILLDIETDGLDINGTIHCIGTKLIVDGKPQETQCYTSHPIDHSDGSLEDCLELISTCDRIVHFNGMAFDIPFMSTYYHTNFNCAQYDLLIIAKLMFTKDQLIGMDRGISAIEPKKWGSFSLDTFGKRMGTELKGDHSDWTKLTPEMVLYCKQDIEVTHALYEMLSSMDNFPAENVIMLEQQVRELVSEQERYGFYFNIKKARELSMKMLHERHGIERKLAKVFKPKFLPEGQPQSTNKLIRRKQYIPNLDFEKRSNLHRYKRPLKQTKAGKIKLPGKNKYKWFSDPRRIVISEKNGEFQNIKLTKFKATDNQIKIWLKDMYNFEFHTYTEKGSVKVDRESLLKLGEQGEDLRRLIKLKKDISQLSGTDNSLIAQFNEDTHSIHGRVDTIGAATHRCLPMNYKIKTLEGPKHYDDVRIGEYIYTYDMETGTEVLSRLKAKTKYNDAMTHRLIYGSQYFDCTLDHKWVTSEGLVETRNLTEESKLII